MERWVAVAKTKPTESEQRLLTYREAGEFLRVAPSTLYAMVSKGVLPVVQFGAGRTGRGCTRFLMKDLEDFVLARRRRNNCPGE